MLSLDDYVFICIGSGMPYKDRDLMLLNRRLCKLRKAIRLGKAYTPRTKEMRDERMRRKLHWRLVQAIYSRLKALGHRFPKKKPTADQKRKYAAYKRAKYRAALAANGKAIQVRQTKEQRRAKDRVRERNRELRQRGGRVSPDIIDRLTRLQRGRCAICRGRRKRFHLDHIEPLARGGPHCDSNVQLLCPPCNLKKAAKEPLQFMQELGRLL